MTPKVGDYINRHFVSSFQKVGTFRIVGGQKQGGNLASYMCTPNGGVLNAVAGSRRCGHTLGQGAWVVENRKTAILESRSDLKRYKEFFRFAHAGAIAEPARAPMATGRPSKRRRPPCSRCSTKTRPPAS